MNEAPGAAARPLIEIIGVGKRFGALQVLSGVSLSIARSEVVCIIGPSGSGKSTLLRCINFLEPYDEGEIRIAGEPVGYAVDARGRRRPVRESEVERQRRD